MASKRRKNRSNRSQGEERRFTVRGVRRDPLDIGKLSKALLGLAMAEAERQAQAEHAFQADKDNKDTDATGTSDDSQQAGGEGHAPA